jgi:glycosyltransferase involved in cell wall biosynthesis
MPRISIVVPTHNNADDLLLCLSALQRAVPADAEILVVDDASTDDTASRVTARGIRVLRRSRNGGPAAARNDGARAVRGDIVFFVDADVVVAPDAVDRVRAAFAADPGLAAVFGSYDARPRHPGTISRYRNLLHHFVHQHGNGNASTFWAGCGAIRRTVFEASEGFDDVRFPWPSIEDIELGYRLRAAGHRIRLDRDLQGTHLKRWTLASLVRTDITRRAIPWARLVVEGGTMPDDLNLARKERLCAILVALAGSFLGLAWFWPWVLGLAAGALLGVLLLNRTLYAFFWRQHGLRFAAACILLHLFYYVYSGLSYVLVWATFRWRRSARRRLLTPRAQQRPS